MTVTIQQAIHNTLHRPCLPCCSLWNTEFLVSRFYVALGPPLFFVKLQAFLFFLGETEPSEAVPGRLPGVKMSATHKRFNFVFSHISSEE